MTRVRDWLDTLPDWLNLAIRVSFIALAFCIIFWCLIFPILLVVNTLNPLWFFLYIIFAPLDIGIWVILFGDDGIL